MPRNAAASHYPGGLQDRLRSVDILRGAAVLAVVITHLPFGVRGWNAGGGSTEIFPPPPFTLLTAYGSYGVQLFLVISGFCIHMRWSRAADVERGVPFLSFWKRRLLRLYPPYFVALLLSLSAAFVLHSFVLGAKAEGIGAHFGYGDAGQFAVDLILLFLMMQNFTPAAWRIGNGAFWSLALEEQLYLLYFPLLSMRRRYGWAVPLMVAFLATILWRVVGLLAFDATPFYWFMVGPALWFPWALGAIAVEAYHGHLTLPAWSRSRAVAALLLTGGVLADPPSGLNVPVTGIGIVLDDILFCAAFFILINRFASVERDGALRRTGLSEALVRLGVWSYSIYLVHLVVMVPVKQFAVEAGWPLELVLGLRLFAGIAAGYAYFRLIEAPFHRRARAIQAG